MRALVAFMAGAAIVAGFGYRLARWLVAADRGIATAFECDMSISMAPLRAAEPVEEDPLGPYRDSMGGGE